MLYCFLDLANAWYRGHVASRSPQSWQFSSFIYQYVSSIISSSGIESRLRCFDGFDVRPAFARRCFCFMYQRDKVMIC